MNDHPKSRRSFLTQTIFAAAGTLVAPSVLGAMPDRAKSSMPPRGFSNPLPELPARVYIDHEGRGFSELSRSNQSFSGKGVRISFLSDQGETNVKVAAEKMPLSRMILRWDLSFDIETLYLGDQWERSYGDLQWRTLQPERVMPWYFAAHHVTSSKTFLAGVKTRPSAFSFWIADASGISLWLDLRNGGKPSLPGDREIAAATIVSQVSTDEATPLAALKKFCRSLCARPRLPAAPVCGNNNWYYAYGHNFTANTMLRDAQFLAELSEGHRNRPFCVIDAGWSPGTSCPGGPWKAGKPDAFPDMPGLASDMKKLGVRPGIWMRPTALMTVDDPKRLRAGPCTVEEKPLDLTLPENLKLMHDDVQRVRSWGYDLIKHDFSTFDIFARWGFEMGAELTDANWSFTDRTLTNAEVILNLYRTLREAAGDSILIGCNTVGHLGAGFFEVQRTGDDTSGHVWERTRRMGVNTLAFRLPQNGAFFSNDPDCAPHTARTPWELDRQFLDLVARSGSALFVSADPETITAEQRRAFRDAMQLALSGGSPGECEPLDWLYTTTPRQWRFGSERVEYNWDEPMGTLPLKV